MSASGIADAVIKATEDGTFDVMIVNFANADMVGHSGKIEPTVKAVETVDACLGRIEPAVRAKGGALLITADHGNAEMMIDPASGGRYSVDQVFLFGSALSTDGEGIEDAERQRILQGLVLPIA